MPTLGNFQPRIRLGAEGGGPKTARLWERLRFWVLSVPYPLWRDFKRTSGKEKPRRKSGEA